MQETDERKNIVEQKLIFLFGAGASIDAGVPDTYSFVNEFKSQIEKLGSQELKETLNEVIEFREKYNEDRLGSKQVDVEQLLATLRRLIDREKDSLLYFYQSSSFLLKSKDDDFVKLEKSLQNFIRKKIIVKNEDKLTYLRELFKFEKPLEIFSTNYDTCIEQLCYINHRNCTDGFDLNWNEQNFNKNFEVKLYKLHGSVIWYQNQNTKECIKIPVEAFSEEEPLDLKLIYGESVKPLLIYPAQKAEYVEPLTDLQLMFKHRLFNGTKFVIAVGYSFRDDYISHMLWDAARVNEDLKLILINPNAQELFNNKLRYIDSDKKLESRISDRVICLPYPFSSIIKDLKNYYLRLESIIDLENKNFEKERKGENPKWEEFLKLCIDCEFSSKVEWVLNEKFKNWMKIDFGKAQDGLIYSFKGLIHSVICIDGNEQKWLNRFNSMLNIFNSVNLKVKTRSLPTFLSFKGEKEKDLEFDVISNEWIIPLIIEERRFEGLLTKMYEHRLSILKDSLSKLNSFNDYLIRLQAGINYTDYTENKSDTDIVRDSKIRLTSRQRTLPASEIEKLILTIERDNLRRIFDGDNLKFNVGT